MPHEDYPTPRIFTNLSTVTLKHRRSFQTVVDALRHHGTRNHWGYPTKLLVQRDGVIKPIFTPEEGLAKLTEWTIPIKPDTTAHLPQQRLTPEWCTTHKKLS
ncbi:Hypothetical predicted protein [Pelobates cultripes]|uniref:Uncharacterized protein n=1 Tax=Pelobates cultripes TaxID=61616 RepID=A0AAD1S8N0_PELCU|nr:Hypothetical predicted protein [Pelobates cultripes]